MNRAENKPEIKPWYWKVLHLWYIPFFSLFFVFIPFALLYMGISSKNRKLLRVFARTMLVYIPCAILLVTDVWTGFAAVVFMVLWISIVVYMLAGAGSYLSRLARISSGYTPDAYAGYAAAENTPSGASSGTENAGISFIRDLQKWKDEIEPPAMKENIQKLIDLSHIILKKEGHNHNLFFARYDNALNKILRKYDEIENTRLHTGEIRKTMSNIEQSLEQIVIAFQNDIHQTYKYDLIDINAETTVFMQELRNKGLLDPTH